MLQKYIGNVCFFLNLNIRKLITLFIFWFTASVCKDCGRIFKFHRLMVYHYNNVHSGLVFNCPYEGCDKKYTQKGNLTHHICMIHKNERFVCPIEACKQNYMSTVWILYQFFISIIYLSFPGGS